MSNSISRDENSRDEKWMRSALMKSQEGQGWTSPRPSVGCVLVQGERIIGAGHTMPGDGNPHAEVVALRQAKQEGESTRGATAYVTLEPCSHYGTTPPCTEALIEAGVARVVSGVRDPNPAVDGRGYEQLREAGVEVVEGFLGQECKRAHEQFLKHITASAPFVTLKCAASLDGKIALRSGESKWISGAESRRRAHLLRHEHDAVLVGIETVLSDDPQLNVRLECEGGEEWKQPARVVVDSSGRLPLEAKLLQDKSTPLYIATTEAMTPEKRQELEDQGAKVLVCSGLDKRVDLTELTKQLYQLGVYSILIEGGARVASSALRAKVIDKVVWFLAPIVMGQGKGAVDDYLTATLADAPRLRDLQTERIDDDLMISGYLQPI